MIQNQHVYAICCRPEVVNDVISCRNVKTLDDYVVLNFEVASSKTFRDIHKKTNFVTTEAAADIDDSIRRKRIRVSLKKHPSSFAYQFANIG